MLQEEWQRDMVKGGLMVTWSHLRNMNDLACSSWLEPSLRQLCPQVKNHLHPLPVYSMSARTTDVRPLDGCSRVQSAPVPPGLIKDCTCDQLTCFKASIFTVLVVVVVLSLLVSLHPLPFFTPSHHCNQCGCQCHGNNIQSSLGSRHRPVVLCIRSP